MRWYGGRLPGRGAPPNSFEKSAARKLKCARRLRSLASALARARGSEVIIRKAQYQNKSFATCTLRCRCHSSAATSPSPTDVRGWQNSPLRTVAASNLPAAATRNAQTGGSQLSRLRPPFRCWGGRTRRALAPPLSSTLHHPRAARTPPGSGGAVALLGHKLGALPSSRWPLFSLFSAVAVLNGWPVRREVDFDHKQHARHACCWPATECMESGLYLLFGIFTLEIACMIKCGLHPRATALRQATVACQQ
eukprot:COSAG05_NODE_301_length_11860_cov_30.927812_6_plen_250_part_00